MTAACPGCARCERAEPWSAAWSGRSPLLVRWPWPGCASALCSSTRWHWGGTACPQLAKRRPGAARCEEPEGRLWGRGGVRGDTWPLSLCWSHREKSGALCSPPALRARGCRGGAEDPQYPRLQRRKPGPAQGDGDAPVAVFVVGKWWLFSRGVSQLKRRDLHVIWVQGWGRSRATRDSREPLASGPRRSAVTAGRAAPSAGTSRGSSFPASCVCAVNK